MGSSPWEETGEQADEDGWGPAAGYQHVLGDHADTICKADILAPSADQEQLRVHDEEARASGKTPDDLLAPSLENEVELATDVPVDGESSPDDLALTWDEFRPKLLRLVGPGNARARRFLQLFEQRYDIKTPAAAFAEITHFLGVYMVREFNHEDFCTSLGAGPDSPGWEERAPGLLLEDLRLACTAMMRLCVSVAKAYGLKKSDWQDVNKACGLALRQLPTCRKLQDDLLPGALNSARSLRFLPGPADEAGELNPWLSEEGRTRFEAAHGVSWESIEVVTSNDEKVVACFPATLCVSPEGVQRIEGSTVVIVALDVVHVADEAPTDDFPLKQDVHAGDTILWEVETVLGEMLEPGLMIEGSWYELANGMHFLSDSVGVLPEWA